MRLSICLLIALMLGGCAASSSSSGSGSGYNPHRCDRTGDEQQRRAC